MLCQDMSGRRASKQLNMSPHNLPNFNLLWTSATASSHLSPSNSVGMQSTRLVQGTKTYCLIRDESRLCHVEVKYIYSTGHACCLLAMADCNKILLDGLQLC